MKSTEYLVVGGGVVGSAIAYGLALEGRKVQVVDGDRNDFRSSRANFGLIWIQSKGDGFPAYQAVTRQSANDWASFHERIQNITSLPLSYEQRGGLVYCVGDKQRKERLEKNQRLDAQRFDKKSDFELLDRKELQSLVPNVTFGEEVIAANFCKNEGQTNPLHLLDNLHAALQKLGAQIAFDEPVTSISPVDQGFEVRTGRQTYGADAIVIAAGLGTPQLAKSIEIDVPIRPQRGQILVTERFAPFLPLPGSGLRQNAEGTIMIGATQEEVGLNVETTTEATEKLASRALKILPRLKHATIVRQWAGLRILSPDRAPIYAQSSKYPAAFSASCHSGITLAPFHAYHLAKAISSGVLSPEFAPFSPERFHVQEN